MILRTSYLYTPFALPDYETSFLKHFLGAVAQYYCTVQIPNYIVMGEWGKGVFDRLGTLDWLTVKDLGTTISPTCEGSAVYNRMNEATSPSRPIKG
jgi:hypothetical protein